MSKLSERLQGEYDTYRDTPEDPAWLVPRHIAAVRALEDELERVKAERDTLIADINAGHPGRTYNRGHAEGRREALFEALAVCKACALVGADECEEAIRELLDEEES